MKTIELTEEQLTIVLTSVKYTTDLLKCMQTNKFFDDTKAIKERDELIAILENN